MKTIGMIGGMSWESTVSYYQALNEGIKQRLGGLHSAKICLHSVDFAEIETLQHQGKWDETAVILSQVAKSVERAGADFILICTNTMHKVAPQMASSVTIPILHIADATAKKLLSQNITRVGLLGTQFTMEQAFYKGRLSHQFGIDVVVPEESDREKIHAVIYDELCKGIIRDESRILFSEVIDKLKVQGVEAVILGCTEIGLLIQQDHASLPLFDTTAIHAEAAIELALNN